MKKLLSNKKIRFILVIILLITGIGYSARGIIILMQEKPAWEDIELNSIKTANDTTVFPFYGEIKLTYYFATSGNEKVLERNALKTEFNQFISDIFRLTDTQFSYLNADQSIIHNLYDINTNPGMEIVVEQELYDALSSAYQFTLESNGQYNLFAGSLYNYWQAIFYSDLPAVNDPLMDESAMTSLTQIVDEVHDAYLNAASILVFDEAEHSVKFQPGILDVSLHLQALKDAVAVDYLCNQLQLAGFDKGYITTESGITATLGDVPTDASTPWQLGVADPRNENTAETKMVAQFIQTGSNRMVTLDDFMNSHFYTVPLGTEAVRRHFYYDANIGEPKNSFRSVSIHSTTDSLNKIYQDALLLFFSDVAGTTAMIPSITSDGNRVVAVYNQGDNSTGNDDLYVLANSLASSFLKIESTRQIII